MKSQFATKTNLIPEETFALQPVPAILSILVFQMGKMQFLTGEFTFVDVGEVESLVRLINLYMLYLPSH